MRRWHLDDSPEDTSPSINVRWEKRLAGGEGEEACTYCNGVMLVSQVAIAVTADRGTASANEQK